MASDLSRLLSAVSTVFHVGNKCCRNLLNKSTNVLREPHTTLRLLWNFELLPVFTFRVKSSNFVSEVLTGLDSESAVKRGNCYFQKQVDTQEVYQAGKGQRTQAGRTWKAFSEAWQADCRREGTFIVEEEEGQRNTGEVHWVIIRSSEVWQDVGGGGRTKTEVSK